MHNLFDKNQDTITLNKFKGNFVFPDYYNDRWKLVNVSKVICICIVDVETNGLNPQAHTIIELAIKKVAVNIENGDLLEVLEEYESFNDPGVELDKNIIQITGITDDQLIGQSIDWIKVNEIFSTTDFILSHNARFDRSFIDKFSNQSPLKIWSCSINHIDWLKHGFVGKSQEMLAVYHGFFYETHRAMSDVNALINLLSLKNQEHNYFFEILNTYKQPYCIIKAANSSINKKDILRLNKYFWDANERVWKKIIRFNDLQSEKEWLTHNVYDNFFKGFVEEIQLIDNFKF